ncbi:MAG: cell envelope integrity protein CreD [Opitutus sp.]
MNLPPVLPRASTSPAAHRRSLFFKLTGITLLIAALHIPLGLTHGVLRERQSFQQQAAREIATLWGQRQTITGPVLAVPYAYRANVVRSKVVAGKVVQVEESDLVGAVAYFLPEVLTVTGSVEPEARHRGIYESIVYTTKLQLAGHFQPDFAAAGFVADRVDWEKAEILVGVSDLRGIRSMSALAVNGGKLGAFESAEGLGCEGLALGAKIVGAAAGEKLTFAFESVLQGSERLDVVPAGKSTRVNLSSPWAQPSFSGAYLPINHLESASGFTAEWQTAHFNRGFGQSWTNRNTENREMMKKLNASAFGVAFTQPVDGYRLVERAEKYGVLFFVLVFTVFFLFEVTAHLRIHPLQYAMVGAALCLFFLGFLALSEFWRTGLAYGVAAAACTLLISVYALSFLRTGWRTLVITSGLGATYGYLYFVLQSQDYALLAGTLALFATLALVMFCTRKINWYTLEPATTATPETGT